MGVDKGGAGRAGAPPRLEYLANMLDLRVLDPAIIGILHQNTLQYVSCRLQKLKNFHGRGLNPLPRPYPFSTPFLKMKQRW